MRPMRIVGAMAETFKGFIALFKERERAMQYAVDTSDHHPCRVENLVTEGDALRYAYEWAREQLPYAIKSSMAGDDFYDSDF